MDMKKKLHDLVAEMNLRKHSNPADLAPTFERHALATVLQNQLTIIEILGEHDPESLARFKV